MITSFLIIPQKGKKCNLSGRFFIEYFKEKVYDYLEVMLCECNFIDRGDFGCYDAGRNEKNIQQKIARAFFLLFCNAFGVFCSPFLLTDLRQSDL